MNYSLLGAILAAGAVSFAADQALPLEGSRNFRDLGGYETTDGKKVKAGRVFRSDALVKLTDKDYEMLAGLKIRTVCDFRTQSERDRDPTKWKGTAPEFLMIEIGGGQGKGNDVTATFMRPLLEGKATPAQMSTMMRDTTAQMPIDYSAQFGQMFRRLVAVGEPLLYHCTAGKDRTGLASAMLLTILGVKRDQIEADYLLVNKLMPPEQSAPAMAKRMEGMVGRPIDPALFAPLMGTKAEWLAAAFDAINQKYGSFDRYRREALGLTDEDVAVLKLRLLQ